uniref:LOB domain-containing protein 35 n=1 Tax=Noccaea caerulescens TaxID=107243 RepID=A0A1J3E7A0_NOCCA
MVSDCCAPSKLLNFICPRSPDSKCIWAQHFPLTNLVKFEKVHRVFGLEGIRNILSNLTPSERESAVTALCYEADARTRDPIFGCVGMVLQHQKDLDDLNEKINSAQNELASIIGPDNVPKYYDLPIPDDFLASEKMDDLTEDQRNQVTQLPTIDAQKILTEMFGKKGDQEVCHGQGADGASTSTGP